MSLRSDDLAAMPLSCLYLLIVALAAVFGTRQAIVLGAAAMSAFLYAGSHGAPGRCSPASSIAVSL